MLLDIIDNLPRLRMSSNQFQIILWLLKECGVKRVPSYDKFRKTQQSVSRMCGTSNTEEHKSTLGNRFFTNNISVALDFANPEVAKHLNFYPEDCGDGPISEVWQAKRWTEFRADELTPMYSRSGAKQFFIEELCQLEDGSYVIPHLWITKKKKLCAECSNVRFSPATGWSVVSGEPGKRTVEAREFAWTYHDIVSRIGSNPQWEDGTNIPEMPNPMRQLAPDRDIYVVMTPIWADDVSGNRSKQYNKHMNMYMANSNLPGRLLQQEYFVRFVSTSPHATSPEQYVAIRDQINETQVKPIPCYNADTQRECAVILRCPGLPADNPQQAEEASHIGGNGNCPCRKCKAGGPQRVKESDDGYHDHHYVGVARSACEIKNELEKQLEAAMSGVAARVTDLQTATGTKDKVTQYWIDILLAKARALKKDRRSQDEITSTLRHWLAETPGDKMNPLLSIAGLDPSQDTPVEILHTILLGVVKYMWHMLHTSWSEDERNLFALRLQSTDIDGLSIAPIRAGYMVQYRNNLIGKDFKTLMQCAPFHVHAPFGENPAIYAERFSLVKAVGDLGAVLWQHEISNMDQYLADLEILIANVLDAFDAVDCKKIIVKIKLHLLPHLIDDIRRYGPAIRNSTEVFECFNAVFRLCSVLSNHQAPSRDIARKFTSMDRVKHILSGGYWKDSKGVWVQASANVRAILHTKPTIQRHLGWVPTQKIQPGRIVAEAAKTGYIDWSATASCTEGSLVHQNLRGSRWRRGKSIIADSGDVCRPLSWIFAKGMSESHTRVGRIKEILVAMDEGLPDTVLLEVFEFGKNRHPDFHAPVLCRPPDGTSKFISLQTTDVLFLFSAQHDCRQLQCHSTRLIFDRQERSESSRQRLQLVHADDDHYVVNIFAIHNAGLLRKAIHRELTKPVPLYEDRRAHHDESAAKLRGIRVVDRAKAAERR
ncbi:hypothetical protein BD626DRAFT_375148, partial [Schizophyllum amplum]